MMRLNKLAHFSLATLSSQVLEFEGKARANLSDTSFLGKLLVLAANVRLDWKVIANYKHSSLFGLIIIYEGKTFYNIDTRIFQRFERRNPCIEQVPIFDLL
jgi:hypothetical protein